jgi:hypothetical protein
LRWVERGAMAAQAWRHSGVWPRSVVVALWLGSKEGKETRESGETGVGGAVGTWEAIPWQSDTRRWRQADGGSYCVAGPRKKKIGLAGHAE